MNLQADLFPYPVMNPDLDDYVDNTSFDAVISIDKQSMTALHVTSLFSLQNEGLKKLIKQGKASFALHIEGVSSSYRKLCIDESRRGIVEEAILIHQLPKKLQVNAMLIAIEDIYNYTNTTFNSDYYGNDFSIDYIQKGDILAFLPTKDVNIDLNHANTSRDSIFNVAAHEKDYMDVNLDGDIATVYLPKGVYTHYSRWGKVITHKDYFISMIFIPALTYVIGEVQAKRVSTDLKWYISLAEILEQSGINIENENALVIAQRLLNNPLVETIRHKCNEDE